MLCFFHKASNYIEIPISEYILATEDIESFFKKNYSTYSIIIPQEVYEKIRKIKKTRCK